MGKRKIALLLHGLAAGKNSKNRKIGGLVGARGYQQKLLGKYDVDVFIHCWNPEVEGEMCAIYQPVSSIFENLKEKYPQVNKGKWWQNAASLFYSYKMVTNLKIAYEESEGFKYDLVIQSRCDNTPEYIPDLERLKTEYIYISSFLKYPIHIADHWFIGSSQNMDRLGEIYDLLEEYKPKVIHGCYLLNHSLVEIDLKKHDLYDKIVEGLMKGGPSYTLRGKCLDPLTEFEWRPDSELLEKYLN